MITISDAYQKADKQALDNFAKTTQRYFHEDLESLYDVLGTSEEIETDRKMLNVYRKLFQDIALRNGGAYEKGGQNL